MQMANSNDGYEIPRLPHSTEHVYNTTSSSMYDRTYGIAGQDSNGFTRISRMALFGFLAVLFVETTVTLSIGIYVVSTPRTVSDQASASCCHAGWTRYDFSCYRFEDIKLNWSQAANNCDSRNAHLVTVESAGENAFIRNQLKTMKLGQHDQFWTAGNDIGVEGHWVWGNNNISIETTFWSLDEPNNADGGEDCISYSKYNDLLWNDETCEDREFFICEIEFFGRR